MRLFFRSLRRDSVGVIPAYTAGLLFCLLRSVLPARGTVVLYDLYLHPSAGIRKR